MKMFSLRLSQEDLAMITLALAAYGMDRTDLARRIVWAMNSKPTGESNGPEQPLSVEAPTG